VERAEVLTEIKSNYMIGAFLTAFLLGFAGSLHCVGMCGPLALALPVRHLSFSRRVLSMGLYHGGRIMMYSLGGLIFGLAGHRVWLAGWQRELSIVLGVVILGMVFVGRAPKGFGFLQRWMGRVWSAPGMGKFFVLGLGNGMLPCGMVYIAIAGALTLGNVGEGVGFMAFFGLGTLPLLLALKMVNVGTRIWWRRVRPYVTALIGVLLILRGLDLGIPFVSPKLPADPGQVISCH
jgi:sulfite exporter TauE/SafE